MWSRTACWARVERSATGGDIESASLAVEHRGATASSIRARVETVGNASRSDVLSTRRLAGCTEAGQVDYPSGIMVTTKIEAAARLLPRQVCFMVDDVPRAAADCAERFGWGPFRHFTADIPNAEYRGWRGRRLNDVALGMAGRVQVELLHVHEGRAAVASYQTHYGVGFQHLGIGCSSREAALERLERLGASRDELNEYGGTRFAFVDVPTGPAMFELLHREDEDLGGSGEVVDRNQEPTPGVLALDRATIVTDDMDSVLRFYAQAFGWHEARAESETLRYAEAEVRVRRFVGRAGLLDLELVEPDRGGKDPYSMHLARGRHGLVHAGGPETASFREAPSLECEWLERGESFTLHDWAGGQAALQVRRA